MSFEFSLQTAIVGSFGSSLILAATLLYLWRLEPDQRPLLFWSLAFFAQTLRMAAQLGVTLGFPVFSLVADILFAGAVFLIWRGSCELSASACRQRLFAALLPATLLWGVFAASATPSFLVRTLPLYALAGGMLIHAGVLLHRLAKSQPGIGHRVLGLLFALLGLHYLDYPFLRPLPGFAPIGFAIAAILMLGIGIVMLIITQRRQQFQLEALTSELRREMIEHQETESRFQSIFESIPNIAVQGYDRNRQVVYWNDASERFYGYRKDEAIGRGIDELLFNPLEVPAFRTRLEEWVAGGPSPAPGEYAARRKDGTTIRVYSTQVMVRNAAGEPEIYCIDVDLSDTLRLQGELEESSERFRAIAESSELGVVVADERGSFIYCNPRYLELTDSSMEEVRSGRWIDHLHPDDRGPMQRHWRQAIATQTGFTMERRVVDAGGTTHWARAHIVPIHSASGSFRGFVATVEDITTLKETERALRFSEAKFAGAFHASLDYITLSDLDSGRIYEVNEAFEQMTGWTRQEVIGHTTTELGIWQDSVTRRAAIEQLRQEGYLREYPLQIGTRDGRWIDCVLNASMINVDGQRYLLGVVRDVSAQKAAEEALRRSEEKFSTIVQYSPVALVITDVETGVLIDVNPAWQELFGFTREQVIGKTSAEFGLWFDNADRDEMYRVLKENNGSIDRHECPYRRADGRRIFGLASARMFDIGGRACYLWSVTDITLRHEVEQRMAQLNSELEARVAARTSELERAQDELIRAEKLASLGALVAGIAHELNTPIGNSVTVASTLHERTAEFAETVAQGSLRRSALNAYLETARTASDLLLRSLDQARTLVASFKQVAVDQTSDQRRRFDLHEVVEEVLTTLSPTIRKTPIRVTMDIPEGIVLDSYPGPLGQVITNFITNSLIHAFEGHNEGSVIVRAGLPEHGQVVMTVQDDGVGIAEEHFRHIFDPFFTTKLGQGGSGLGLHIVYNIVTRVLGGRISLDSQLGKGTTFMLTMPLSAPRDEEHEKP